jgi:cysteinyl-tRNA synthetase, unknown class
VVTEVSSYAKGRNPKFVILVRVGAELLVRGDREDLWDQIHDPTGINYDKRLPLGAAFRPYIKAIDGVVFDNLYCGDTAYENKPLDQLIKYRLEDDKKIVQDMQVGVERPLKPAEQGPFSNDPAIEAARSAEIRRLADLQDHKNRVLRGIWALKTFNRPILSIENCPHAQGVEQALDRADRDKVLTFAAVNDAKLDIIPTLRPRHENAEPVDGINKLKTWLPNSRGDRYGSKEEWISALGRTNYDAVVVDVGWRGQDLFTKADIARLKYKALGTPRLVMAEMPMGRAFDWRWYWHKDWVAGKPSFLFAVDRSEPGAFIIDPMSPQWLEILGKYVAGLMDLGFDGVMMDDIDTYLWFEDIMPLDR